jgi:hydrogenase 3 maturation protease
MIATPHDTADIGVFVPLKRLLSGRVCILGVGNRHRRDDGVGSLIAERLAARHPALTIDAGTVPENYLEKVARSCPETILIIDAVGFGGYPGEIRLLDPDTIAPSGLSSHALSLRMTAEYLKARTQARLVFLAIQPADVRSGTVLSDEVSQAVKRAQETLYAALEERVRNRNSEIGNSVMSPGGA